MYTSVPTLRARSVGEALRRFRALELKGIPELPPGREWVYFLEAAMSPILVRIAAARDIGWRLVTAQSMCPVPLKLTALASAPSGTARAIQRMFLPTRSHANWYALTEDLAELIAQLPRAAPIAETLAVRWAAQVGVMLGEIDPSTEIRGSQLGETTFDVFQAITS